MATVKKAFQPILAILEANPDALVADVLPEVLALVTARTGAGGGAATTFHRNDEGKVVAIKCYYFKQWMNPAVVEFGKKASSPSGLNNMCKEGVSNWTKQQREFKKATAELLDKVASGEIAPEDISAYQEDMAATRDRVVESDLEMFETLEELLEA